MKKAVLGLLFTLITMTGFSQEFLGIKVDGTKQEVVNKFIAKGFKIQPVEGGSDVVTTMKGSVSGTTYEINIVHTPITKKVWKISVYLPEKIGWYSLKSCYNEYLQTLIGKYGEPEKSYEFFSSPYYEGDGYEMSAVKLEKCTYYAYWTNVSIEISRWAQVKISYENLTNSELNDKEKEKLNSNIF